MGQTQVSCDRPLINQGSADSVNDITTGAERMDEYLPLLKNKRIGLLINQTSVIGNTHLLDTLISRGVQVARIFAPEHGFRGDKSDGVTIKDGLDTKTGTPVISLYGKNKKPTADHMSDLDVVIYDIQDVGARFYTYISAMHYMMESAANYEVDMIILDRPNPNGDYVDGPVWELDRPTYVGMHPIPVVHGLSTGELAKMIVGERWYNASRSISLTIIPCKGWDHTQMYSLKIKPSPNLPNDQSIALYPSLCFFEGTEVSVGRGTYEPFQMIGIPDSSAGNFTFTPRSIPGMSKYPKFENQKCYGLDLRNTNVERKINLSYLISFYNKSQNKNGFFNNYFIKLAGTPKLQKQIEDGLNESQIRQSWEESLMNFKKLRKKYLLYPDFE